MQFYRKKTRIGGVPIVPLVDILTILLIFFIVHTQWKQESFAIHVDVPGAEFITTQNTPTQRTILSVTADSEIFVNGQSTHLAELQQVLLNLNTQQNPAKLQLDIDKKAQFGVLVAVWDALSAAGINAADVPTRVQQTLPASAK